MKFDKKALNLMGTLKYTIMEEKNTPNVDQYKEHYSESGLWNKIGNFAKKAGIKTIYIVLLLFYALQSDKISAKHKALIYGALGYFILPADLVPDFIPAAGFTDDFAALLAALASMAMCIDSEIKAKAKTKLHDWFGDYDEGEIKDVV